MKTKTAKPSGQKSKGKALCDFTTKEVNMEYSIIFCLTIIAFMSYNINCTVCGNICTCEYEHPELEDN